MRKEPNTIFLAGQLLASALYVFVKQVIRRIHAESLILEALLSIYGLSQTGPADCKRNSFDIS